MRIYRLDSRILEAWDDAVGSLRVESLNGVHCGQYGVGHVDLDG